MTLFTKPNVPILAVTRQYIGEIGGRFSERVIDHSGRDDMSHLVEYAEKTRQKDVNIDHFEILSNGYKKKPCRGTTS